MPPVRRGRVATRSATRAVHTRRRGGRAGGSTQVPPAGVPIQVPPVGDGQANANVVQNIDPPVPVIDAGPEGASVMGLDPRKFEELISTSIAKGVEIGVAKALAILEPGRSAPTLLPQMARSRQPPRLQAHCPSVLFPFLLWCRPQPVTYSNRRLLLPMWRCPTPSQPPPCLHSYQVGRRLMRQPSLTLSISRYPKR